jgi:hypothetical protein
LGNRSEVDWSKIEVEATATESGHESRTLDAEPLIDLSGGDE